MHQRNFCITFASPGQTLLALTCRVLLTVRFFVGQGTVAYTHTPVFIITAEGEYSRLCTFLETILTMVS